MELAEEKKQVFRSKKFKSRALQYKATPKAFQVLSSGIYSRKEAAVVREISCNAYDAHVAIGKPETPFDVHLPTVFEPFFSVRDYGPGLSPDEMEEYGTYFESDKATSNDYVGCFGLGAKAPFCYTDSYTVISRHNGVKYVYNFIVSESGEPESIPLTQHECDEPSGLEVIVPIKSEDFHTFKREAAYYYHFFEVHPNLLGTDRSSYDYLAPKYTVTFEMPGMKIVHYPDNYGQKKHIAVMGGVPYRLDISKIENEKLRKILDRHSSIFYFDIGAIAPAVSREDLQYSKLTLDGIRDKVAQVVAHMEAEAQESIVNAESYWDACCEFTRVQSLFAIDIPIFGGREVTDKTCARIDKVGPNGSDVVFERYFYNQTKKNIGRSIYGASFDVADNVKFMVKDIKVGHHTAARDMSIASKSNVVILPNDPEVIEHAKKHFGIIDKHISYASKCYIKPARMYFARGRQSHFKLWDGVRFNNIETADLPSYGVYCIFSRDYIRHNGERLKGYNLYDALKYISDIPLIAVTPSNEKRAKALGYQYFADFLQAYLDNIPQHRLAEHDYRMESKDFAHELDSLNIKYEFMALAGGLCADAYGLRAGANKLGDDDGLESFMAYANSVVPRPRIVKTSVSLKSIYDDLSLRYPLLKVINRRYYDESLRSVRQHILHYIRLIDGELDDKATIHNLGQQANHPNLRQADLLGRDGSQEPQEDLRGPDGPSEDWEVGREEAVGHDEYPRLCG